MKLTVMCFSLGNVVSVLCAGAVFAAEPVSQGDTWGLARQEARRLAVIGEIRARLLDRKDIKSRYVCVRFDGKNLQLAGFVQSTNVAADIERIARDVATPDRVTTYWSIADDLQDRDPYRTFVGERASDFKVWLKVKAKLSAPDMRSALSDAEVLAIDVYRGVVVVFLITDAAPAARDLEPHMRSLTGVKGFECRLLRAFQEGPEL